MHLLTNQKRVIFWTVNTCIFFKSFVTQSTLSKINFSVNYQISTLFISLTQSVSLGDLGKSKDASTHFFGVEDPFGLL